MLSTANDAVSQHHSTSTSSSKRKKTSRTISACSSSANPSEDWTQITDFQERRRLQTRIAQRIFRMKQKQRMEEAGNHIEIDPPTNEELASTTSAPNLSPTNKHQQEIHSFYDMANSFSLPEVSPTNGQQQEMHSYFDIAIATPESTSNISPIDDQQQEMHHFCDIDIPISGLDLSPTNSPLPEVTSFWNAVSPEMVSLSDNFTMPLHQMSAHSPPLCSHALTPGTELYLHRHQQQQQQSAPNMWNNRTSMNYSPEFLAHEFSHPGCICPTSPEPTSCCSGSGGVGLQQQQQMRIVHHSIPPSYWPWSRSKTCLHSSYGQFDNSCGSPHGMLPSPAPSKRGHCCHHNEYFPIMDHATPMYNRVSGLHVSQIWGL